jgi:hypothetical protein
MTVKGLSDRRSLRVIGMSASALRYQPRPDRNGELRDRIIGLAQRYRRYGASMIYLKLRQAGEFVNHKRVERRKRAVVTHGFEIAIEQSCVTVEALHPRFARRTAAEPITVGA